MKEDYIYMDCKIRMSNMAMANLLYAAIMTNASIVASFGIGIKNYNRKQNAYNRVDFKIHLPPNEIVNFENISGTKLTKPITIHVNTN